MEQVVIETPEHVEFTYELSGLGSRFLAFLLDHLFFGIPLVITYFAAFMAYFSHERLPPPFDTVIGKFGQDLIAAIFLFLGFIIQFGYFPVFETIWNGQTPGKRLVGIRVIKAGGYPLRFVDIFLRNIFLLADMFPGFYLVGSMFIFFDPYHRRIGDLVAQTLVVKERYLELPQSLTEMSQNSNDLNNTTGIKAVSDKTYALIRDFLTRCDQFEHTSRVLIAKKLALPILKSMGEPENKEIDYESFLEDVASHYREHCRI